MAQMSSTNTTYKISFKKIARAALAELRVHKKLAIITYVLYGVALLLFLFNSEVFSYVPYEGEPVAYLEFYPSGWGIFFAVCGAVVCFFTVLIVFRDMNNQQLCDVSMALPIRASERFFSKLLCLVYIQLLPQLVSVFGGNGIRVLLGRIKYGDLPGNAEEYMTQIVLVWLAATMFAMAVTVLCVCCCGAPAESSYFSIILMAIINALPVAFVYNLLSNCAGYSNNIFEMDMVDLGYWGFLFALNFEKLIPHCIVGSLISLAVMLLSGLIYVKRDAKTVGTPIASRVFFEVVMTLSCITVFLAFVMSDAALWGLLVAAVAYIIINIIVSRAKINALSFVKWGGKYLITVAAFTVVLVVAIKTGGFGYIYERPAADYLEGASYDISYYDYSYEDSDGGNGKHMKLYTDSLTAEQADKVMSICKKHLANGRANINPFDVIFGYYYPHKMSYVSIRAQSNKLYDTCPYPRSQFESDYYDRERFCLSYRQGTNIPYSDLLAMTEELKALDYVHEYDPSASTSEPQNTTTYYD